MRTKNEKEWFYQIIDESNRVALNQFHVKSGDFESVYKYIFKCFFWFYKKKNANSGFLDFFCFVFGEMYLLHLIRLLLRKTEKLETKCK